MIFLAIALTAITLPPDPPQRLHAPGITAFPPIEGLISVPYDPNVPQYAENYVPSTLNPIAQVQAVQTAEPFALVNTLPYPPSTSIENQSINVPEFFTTQWQTSEASNQVLKKNPTDMSVESDGSSYSLLHPTEPSRQDSLPISSWAQWTQYRRGVWRERWLPNVPYDDGLGAERLALAPWVIETTQGNPSVGLRMRFDRGLANPNRSEYIWARPGVGPSVERRLDLIDSILRMEVGNSNAVAFTEFSMRSVNPELNGNTTGFGDMVIGAKGILFNNQCSQVSSVFRTVLKTGPAQRGLGSGHVSLEPGILGSHRLGRTVMLHGELKYSLPIAGSKGFAGDVLKTGIGISTLWRDWDRVAWMPTLELQSTSFLFGQETNTAGLVSQTDGRTAIDLYPGFRVAWQKPRVGIIESGFAYGLNLTDRDWFDSRLIAEIRWVH